MLYKNCGKLNLLALSTSKFYVSEQEEEIRTARDK